MWRWARRIGRLRRRDADAETRRSTDAELLALPVRVSDRRPPLFLLQLWGTEEVSKQQSWANMCWAADRQQPSAMTGTPEFETPEPAQVKPMAEKPVDWIQVNADFSL